MSDTTVVIGYIVIIFIMCKAWNWHVMKRYAKQKEKKLNFTKIFCEKYLEKIEIVELEMMGIVILMFWML